MAARAEPVVTEDPVTRIRAVWRYLRHGEATITLPPSAPYKPVAPRLRDRDFRDQEFLGCRWSRAYIERCDFRGAHLTDIDLRSAMLYKCDFRGARLAGVDLRGADLEGCDLRGVDLTGCDLRRADLRRAIGLTSNHLREATTDETTRLPDRLPTGGPMAR